MTVRPSRWLKTIPRDAVGVIIQRCNDGTCLVAFKGYNYLIRIMTKYLIEVSNDENTAQR